MKKFEVSSLEINNTVVRPVVRHDVNDGHKARDPADHQHPHSVLVGQVLPLPLGEVHHEVDPLQYICHGVPEADANVDEDDLEDDESGEG